jgi:hypothetical protein
MACQFPVRKGEEVEVFIDRRLLELPSELAYRTPQCHTAKNVPSFEFVVEKAAYLSGTCIS